MGMFDGDDGDDVLGEMVYRNRWIRIVKAPNQPGISTVASVSEAGHGYVVVVPDTFVKALAETQTLGFLLYLIHLMMMLVINADHERES